MDKQEAIKILKNFHDTSALFSVRTALETVFPELKEDEDERIRKALIKYCKLQQKANNIGFCGISLIDIIAWLEKQGNNLVENGYTNNKDIIKYADNYSHEIWHKLMDNFENIKDYHIGCNDVSDIVLNAIIDAYNWFEKRGESIKIKKGKNYLCTKTHKYAGVEWIEGIKYYSPEDYSLVNQGCTCYCPKYSKEEHNNFFKEVEYNGWLEKQGEKTINQPDFEIPFGAKDSELIEESYYIPKGYHAEISKDKVTIKKGEQKPVWSNEDMFKVQRICQYLCEAKKYYADITEVRDCISWLKSLKQRMGG